MDLRRFRTQLERRRAWQMWQGRAHSQCRSCRGEPSPGADVGFEVAGPLGTALGRPELSSCMAHCASTTLLGPPTTVGRRSLALAVALALVPLALALTATRMARGRHWQRDMLTLYFPACIPPECGNGFHNRPLLLAPPLATSAPELGSLLPHLHRTGLTPAISAPGLGSPLCHICTGTNGPALEA